MKASFSAANPYALYPHQLDGVEFLKNKGRAILGDDMGLGKTRQAIVALREACPDGCVLVVCPASLKINWVREIRAVERVTVEYFVADQTLDDYIARLMDRKLALISAVESDDLTEPGLLNQLYADLANLAPALMQENRALATEGDAATRLEQLAASVPRPESKTPITEMGMWEFPSSRDPDKRYRVTFGRAGHLECTCEGFGWRGKCSHARKVRALALAWGVTIMNPDYVIHLPTHQGRAPGGSIAHLAA